MKIRSIFIGACVLIAGFVWAQSPTRRIVDLTYAFSSQSVYWPTADGFVLKADAAGLTEKGYYYTANSFSAAEHGGTHLDAPAHFAQGMPTVDRIPLERLLAPGVLVDVTEGAAKNPDYQVSASDFAKWEEKNGRIADGCIVLLRTGWGKYYPDKRRYLGTDERGAGAVARLHFPGLGPAAARWIVTNRKIAAIGIDTASIDYGQSQLFETHQALFKAGIPALENVANLDKLPTRGFDLIALPMKIEGGSGAPLRIVAVFPR